MDGTRARIADVRALSAAELGYGTASVGLHELLRGSPVNQTVAYRFCGSALPGGRFATSGFVLPKERRTIRSRGTPSSIRYSATASARRRESCRLRTSGPSASAGADTQTHKFRRGSKRATIPSTEDK